MLKIVPTGSPSERHPALPTTQHRSRQAPHPIGRQSKITEHLPGRLASIDRIQELSAQFTRKYAPELQERAVRMYRERLADPGESKRGAGAM